MTRLFIASLLFILPGISFAQPKTDTLLTDLLFSNHLELLQTVLRQKDTYRVQIIYTQINRDKKNKPSFRNYYFNVDTNLYFNPASTVKMPLAFLSLEKINGLKKHGVDMHTTMQIDSSYPGQLVEYSDSTSETGLPSIAHYIRKAFLVSDNDAYNRMYQFVGQQSINKSLREKGYGSTRITRQFMGFTPVQNRHTNQVRFVDRKGDLLYTQPPAFNPDSFYFGKIIKIGKAHYNRDDSLIHEPIDFTKVNSVPLEDLQQMLQSVMCPSSVPMKQHFHLSKRDYRFLYRYLSQYPSETDYPKYDTSGYYDSYVKFFFRGNRHVMPEGVRVFNKVGWAYGFLTDVSYVADFHHRVEYMLTATLYVNSDEVLNDDKYEYETVGWPFLYELGKLVYEYELQRTRAHKPRLKAFRIKYGKRDPRDTRPSIRNVDN